MLKILFNLIFDAASGTRLFIWTSLSLLFRKFSFFTECARLSSLRFDSFSTILLCSCVSQKPSESNCGPACATHSCKCIAIVTIAMTITKQNCQKNTSHLSHKIIATTKRCDFVGLFIKYVPHREWRSTTAPNEIHLLAHVFLFASWSHWWLS